ncbi:MAG: transglycosylase SLT domain-containing protein [Litoreibacter sp.]|nr:transglycosylase SLT domain-containing protein [Litoreibacter sp.]
MHRLIRVSATFLMLCISVPPAAAQTGGSALANAVEAAQAREWDRVDALQARLRTQASRDVVDWLRLRGQQGSFGECRSFLARNGDWPGLPLLRQRCEASIARGSNPAQVLEFFGQNLPRTGTGSLRLAEALIRTDRTTEAARELQRGWLTFNMSQSEHDAFVERNGLTIRDLHEERLDMLLWRGNSTAAKRMYPLVSSGWRKLAEARIALRENKRGVDNLIAAVPTSLKDDPGLAFERFLWRAKKGRDAGALKLLMDRSASLEDLGNPEEWANRRRSIARQQLRDGSAKTAYRIASRHYLKAGSAYADLEWLSGFIALRKLNDPQSAITHFRNFRRAVQTPISLGRAGYWLGRAYDAAGQSEDARSSYTFGALFQSSFYGQLAAEKAGVAPDAGMTGTERFSDWRRNPFTRSSVFLAAMELFEAGERNLAERFLVHLAESQDRQGLGQLADLALELEEPHIALMISKQAARMGIELYKTYFPVATPAGLNLPVAQEFALSIARRESEFDPVVISPAGARGLMQLMPRTAKAMAGEIGEKYSRSRLLTDPRYNARLGSAYLAELSERYDGNPVLMASAYNAGPSRANRWMEDFGDPRAPGIDVVDWIESIPFRETRNYVMRVTESFAPYRARLTGKSTPIRLSRDLKR